MARADVAAIQRRVLEWFERDGRAFPWREHRDPYKTMVAEVMLQQTQTARVVPIYLEFLKRFPTLESLARAPGIDVIRAWKGLGYNRRAVNLQRAAQEIVHRYGGVVPEDPAILLRLPGLGEYTAAAIACVAFDAQVPVVDVNVRRVLARAALGVAPERAPSAKIDAITVGWLPQGEAYRWSQALMDIGATRCRARLPLCASCPLERACAYRARGRHLTATPAINRQSPFEGSARQKRGRLIDQLRASAASGVTLAALARAAHPRSSSTAVLDELVSILSGLERDGLVVLSDAARRGSARGRVRLPH